MKRFVQSLICLAILPGLQAGEVFLEAESFKSADGWAVETGANAAQASGLTVLNGASGAKDGVATATVSIKDAGRYHVWVRYSSDPTRRGPFHVTALAGGRELGDGLFDAAFEGTSTRNAQTWRSFDVVLPEGVVTLRLGKHENKNSTGLTRRVDCLLLTMDDKLVPNHLNYGAQTFVRVKLGEGYEKPTYIHIFADHFHAPWYQHYSLGKKGAVVGVSAAKEDKLVSGEQTPWCNITPMIYQDSGTVLHITARHAYTDYADHMGATFEFATAPEEKAIVRTIKVDNKPGTVAVFLPPNLLTKENLELLKTDREIAEMNGKAADAFAWPKHGKPLEKFPFFVTASVENSFTPSDAGVLAREQKTLDYFGFTNEHLRRIGGAWFMKDKSYCNPDVEKMKTAIAAKAEAFKKEGGKAKDVVFAELTDEPTGQSLDFAAADPSYQIKFRAWLKGMGKTPADLLVKDWEAVKVVTDNQRDEFPALYYFSQRFRTRALGDFMDVQHDLIDEFYGGNINVLANFSDGAVYGANFYVQGVDYFELLSSKKQNAIWGEDWANGSSTYQCASFNVDLMRAAAKRYGQTIGHHLVAHAGRKAWDIKLKATSELARGVRIMNNFCYGPVWATHEGGPYWRSHVWQGKQDTWFANAAITREVGAVEDMLMKGEIARAGVAILYSSSSDAWTVNTNYAYGFDRMHTWLALTHAQIPVDIVSEQQAEGGDLDSYAVCYVSGPNLTRAAAEKLKSWVKKGCVLIVGAGAATRDEYNRPLHTLDDILPATRAEAAELQAFRSSGRYLKTLAAKDTVAAGDMSADVLSVKQALTPKAGATVLGRFKNNEPAVIKGEAGLGNVYCMGFLPALAYIKSALDARTAFEEKHPGDAMLERSANPWEYPAAIRDFIVQPVLEAGVVGPIQCSEPLVDAVYMPNKKGILISLANYTNKPIESLKLRVAVRSPVDKIESVLHGDVAYKQASNTTVEVVVPLGNNDYLKLYYK